MLKITLIVWIFFFVLKILYNILVSGMSIDEKLSFKFNSDLPMRIIVLTGIIAIDFIAAIILTIITIIKW